MINDNMLEIQSEVVHSVHWSPDTLELRVRFHSGGLYVYFDVGAEDMAKLLFNGSIGRSFLDNVKGQFRYERIND